MSTNYAEGHASSSGPSGIDASDGTISNYIQVTWDSVPGAAFYRLYRSETDSVPSEGEYYVDSLGGTSYQDSGVGIHSVDPYTTYYYWVRAYTTTWTSPTGPDTGWRPYETAHNIAATDGDYYDRVDLTWLHDDKEIDFYVIYRSTSSDPGTAESVGSSLLTSFSDNTGQTGTIYNYWIKSCDFSSRCSELAGPDTGCSLVNDTENIAASDGTSADHVEITWDPVNGVTEYNVYRHTTNVATPTHQIDTVTDSEEDLDTSATPGRTYYYWIEGCGDDYCNDMTNNDTGWRALTAPVNLSATDGTDTSQVTISWDNAAGAEYYEVWRADTLAGTKTRIEASTTSLSHNDTTAIPAGAA